MEQGRAWSSGAAAALSGVVLTGGATFGAAVAEAAPVVPHAPAPPVCTIGTTPYLFAPVKAVRAATVRRGVAADATGQCIDAISKDVLGPTDVAGHALVRVPAVRPKPRPAPVTTTTAPKPAPATTTPAPTTTTTPTPTTTTTPPAAAGGAASGAAPVVPVVPVVLPAGPGTAPAASGATSPSSAPSAPSATTTAPRPSALRRATVPAVVPGGGAPTLPAAPAAPPAAGPGPASANPLAAPLGAVAPGDAAAVPAVEPASYLDPLGAPGIGALPGEPAILQTLGGDTAGVTTSSRVQALGLDALHRGGGVPAVVGVTIMAGLGGLALRHRVLQRIRRDAPAAGGGPDGVDGG